MVIKDAVRFFKEVRLELSKVVWPKFDEWVGSTVVVLVLVALFAMYLGLVDQVFSRLAHIVLGWYGG